jgi:transcriptional regulator of met regulon
MRTFITKHQKTGLKITFKYDLNGVLRELVFDGDWVPELVQKIINKIPVQVATILEDIRKQKLDNPWLFAEITDLSFEAFYKRYPKKVGRKGQTERMYNKLSDADKMEAILYIADLIKLKNDGTAFPYPATYLNQKYWK